MTPVLEQYGLSETGTWDAYRTSKLLLSRWLVFVMAAIVGVGVAGALAWHRSPAAVARWTSTATLLIDPGEQVALPARAQSRALRTLLGLGPDEHITVSAPAHSPLLLSVTIFVMDPDRATGRLTAALGELERWSHGRRQWDRQRAFRELEEALAHQEWGRAPALAIALASVDRPPFLVIDPPSPETMTVLTWYRPAWAWLPPILATLIVALVAVIVHAWWQAEAEAEHTRPLAPPAHDPAARETPVREDPLGQRSPPVFVGTTSSVHAEAWFP